MKRLTRLVVANELSNKHHMRKIHRLFGRVFIEDVFTPRGPVNRKMYINRGQVEDDLARSANDTLHIIIFGNSGCGKSWLYKKVFKEKGIFFLTVNLSGASSQQSIAKELVSTVGRRNGTGRVKKAKSHGFSWFITYSETEELSTELDGHDAFLNALKHCRKLAGRRPAFLVFENLELIFEQRDLLRELGNIIALLDDDQFAKFDVRIAIVGTPSNIRNYFRSVPRLETIANRLIELEEIARLSDEDVARFVERGFRTLLKYREETNAVNYLIRRAITVTRGNAQRLHEFCKEVALQGQQDRFLSLERIEKGEREWLRRRFHINQTTVASWIVDPARETALMGQYLKDGYVSDLLLQNLYLCALGLVKEDEFTVQDVTELIQDELSAHPVTQKVLRKLEGQIAMRTGSMLAKLADDINGASHPILDRFEPPSGNRIFRFRDMQYQMCLSSMFNVFDNGRRVEINHPSWVSSTDDAQQRTSVE